MNGDHLVSESMRRVQHVSGFGKQDEILDPGSLAAGVIVFDHISESLDRRSRERRRPGIQSMRTIAQQA